MAAVPPLFSDLAAAVDLDPSQAAPIRGPRLWWCGPLDVEGLALGSAQAAATGLSHLTGRDLSVDAERVAASFASISHLRVNGRRPQTAGALSGFHATADGWVRAIRATVPALVRAVKPTLLVTQHGADTHRSDALADFSVTLEAQREVMMLMMAARTAMIMVRWKRRLLGRAADSESKFGLRVDTRFSCVVELTRSRRPTDDRWAARPLTTTHETQR